MGKIKKLIEMQVNYKWHELSIDTQFKAVKLKTLGSVGSTDGGSIFLQWLQ